MKTVSDIMEQAEHLHLKQKKKLFALYENIKEIQELLAKRENFEDVEYEFDECGSLVSYLEIPKEVLQLPEVEEFLSQEYGYVKGDRLYQFQGDPITVNWNHKRDQYFVYDAGTSKPIIKKREEWMDDLYVEAVIAQYQTKRGIFEDVVMIDGCYLKHVNFTTLLQRVSSLDDEKEIQEVIETYEQEN